MAFRVLAVNKDDVTRKPKARGTGNTMRQVQHLEESGMGLSDGKPIDQRRNLLLFGSTRRQRLTAIYFQHPFAVFLNGTLVQQIDARALLQVLQ